MKAKIKLEIIIPIIIAIILVAVFVYLDYRNQAKKTEVSKQEQQEQQEEKTHLYKPEPISPSQNSRRSEQLSPTLGCAGPPVIKPAVLKEPDKEWRIDKNGGLTKISLGKYRITNPEKLVLDIPKLWLYFFSKDLSDREDNLYGLDKSYTSKIKLVVNGYEREAKLGGDKYMFIELADYPLGDLYPYDKETTLDFEFIIEFQCKNLEKGTCLDNQGKPLDYINDADIKAQIRIFAVGCEAFSNDIIVNANFKYGP